MVCPIPWAVFIIYSSMCKKAKINPLSLRKWKKQQHGFHLSFSSKRRNRVNLRGENHQGDPPLDRVIKQFPHCVNWGGNPHINSVHHSILWVWVLDWMEKRKLSQGIQHAPIPDWRLWAAASLYCSMTHLSRDCTLELWAPIISSFIFLFVIAAGWVTNAFHKTYAFVSMCSNQVLFWKENSPEIFLRVRY